MASLPSIATITNIKQSIPITLDFNFGVLFKNTKARLVSHHVIPPPTALSFLFAILFLLLITNWSRLIESSDKLAKLGAPVFANRVFLMPIPLLSPSPKT